MFISSVLSPGSSEKRSASPERSAEESSGMSPESSVSPGVAGCAAEHVYVSAVLSSEVAGVNNTVGVRNTRADRTYSRIRVVGRIAVRAAVDLHHSVDFSRIEHGFYLLALCQRTLAYGAVTQRFLFMHLFAGGSTVAFPARHFCAALSEKGNKQHRYEDGKHCTYQVLYGSTSRP